MKKWIYFLILGFFLTAAASAQVDEILKLKEKIIDIQNKGELGFRNFSLCSNIAGFASYVPLAGNVLDKQGSLLVYYEPVNVFTNKKEGLYEVWYMQDMTLLKDSGEVLQEWNDILNFHYTTKSPVMDLFAQNSIDLKGSLPAGKYKFKAVLKDKLKGTTATKTVDFEIR